MEDVEIPQVVCWWCRNLVDSNRMYPEIPDALDLHDVVFVGVRYSFDDGESRIVCHRCLDLFYRWCSNFRKELAALAS